MISQRAHSLAATCASRIALSVFLVLAVLTLQGCGGGTTGTGGTGSSQFSGRITSLEGIPVSGANVILAETGDTAVSDEAGSFDIESTLPGDSATFLVETVDAQASTTLANIPPGPHDVTIELKLDKKKNTVSIESQDIAPPKKPRKTPAPLPVATSTPIVVPTAAIIPTITPLPMGTNVAESSPTPTFSPTPDAIVTFTPTPVATIDPSVPRFIIFRGVINGDSQLLKAIRLGLLNSKHRFKIHQNGTFFFKAALGDGVPVLEVIFGRNKVQVPLEVVTSGAVRVILNLSVSIKGSGGLVVTVNSARIAD